MSSTAAQDGVAVAEGTPATGVWSLDPAHSTIGFTVRHLVSKVRGTFQEFEGQVTVAEPAEHSVVEGTVKAASITTNQEQRDQHLRNSDFFDAETYPELRFRSTAITRTGETRASVTGDLTIKGTTRPVVFDVDFLGVASDHYGRTKAGFSAKTVINREDWGLSWNTVLEAGGVMVGKDVTIEAEVQFLQTPPA